MSGILRLESLTKGNTLKQGDKTPLKYRLFDADGEKLNIAGKSAQVRLVYPDFLTIGYEKDGLTVAQDDTVTFTIDKVIPAKLYHVEIIVDNKFIFPSRADESKFTVDKSSLGTESSIIEIVGVDAVARKATGMMKQDEKFIDDMTENVISDSKVQSFAQGIDAKATNALSLSESADTLSKSVQEQFNQVIIDGDSSVEAAQARVDASGQTNPTLKARLDKEHNEVTTQLAQTRNLKSWELDSKVREERGIVVFISDDARQEDWNNLRPIFNEEYAPLCLAAIANKVGTGQYLTKEQLIQLESEGHEILSHSLDHSGEDRIPSASAQEAERQYKESKDVLRGMGLTVNNYAVPYGDYRQRERLLSKKHFRASRTSDYGNQSGLNLSPIATHELKTLWLDETWGKTNFEYFKTHIDLAVEKNALLIISTHGQQVSQTATQNVFRQVIQYAQQKSEVMTLNDALDIMGNIIEVGDYSYGIDNRSAKPGGHFVVGANGAVSNLVRSGKFNLSTPFADFPFGDNSYILTYGELGGTSPTGGGGTLRNVKTHINPNQPLQAFNYQTFKGYGSGEVYIRHLQSSFEFGEWKLFSAKPNYAVYTYSNSYTLEPKETKTFTVEAHTFQQNAPISVNPQYGPGDNVLFSHYLAGDGKLRIVLFNSGDTTVYISGKNWNIMRVTL